DSDSSSESSSSSSESPSRSPSRSRRDSSRGKGNMSSSQQKRRRPESPVKESRSSKSSADLNAWRKARDDAQAGPRQRYIERPSGRDGRSYERSRGESSRSPPSPRRRQRKDVVESPRRRKRKDAVEDSDESPPTGSPRKIAKRRSSSQRRGWFELSLSPSRGTPPETRPNEEERSGGRRSRSRSISNRGR
ncbi:Splicing factor, arginine/serine-rich, putative, partial [Perkinsus marinus ATCC 50983]